MSKSHIESTLVKFKSRFVEMFGDPVTNPLKWDKVPLSFVLESIDNGKSYVCDSNQRLGDYPGILKLSAISSGAYKPEENKSLLDEQQLVENATVHNGDLLFSRKNTPELVGISTYVYSTPSNLMMPDLIFRLNTKSCCNRIYLWKLINHELFRECLKNIASGSAKSMSNISKERLRNLEIILPPSVLQQQFADFVTAVDKSKYYIQKAIKIIDGSEKE